MKFLRKVNIFSLFLLVALYLFLPANNLLTWTYPGFAVAEAATEMVAFSSGTPPCGGCPCHQEQSESGCCDTGSHGCSCHTSPPASFSYRYAPAIIETGFFEQVRDTLDVYLQIFVPPQNHA